MLARGEAVIGIDNFSDYYDPVLKFARLKPLREDKGFTFLEADIADRDAMLVLPERHSGLDRIVHLAAQPGVRHSLVDPYVYVQTNVMGHLVMLELAVAVVAPAPIVVAPAPIVATPAPVVVTPAPVVSYSVPAPVTSVGVTVTGPIFRVRHLASVVVGTPLPVITASPVFAVPYCIPGPVIVSYP